MKQINQIVEEDVQLKEGEWGVKIYKKHGSLGYRELIEYMFDHGYEGSHYVISIDVPMGMLEGDLFEDRDYWLLENAESYISRKVNNEKY